MVAIASRPEEKKRLEERYEAAKLDFEAAGLSSEAEVYEKAVAASEAVINRPFGELMRLCYSQDEVYSTFYQRTSSGQRISTNESWDWVRAMADTALFGDLVKAKVRFAALTLTKEGLSHYGDCSLLLSTDMIAHRSAVFEENSVLFMKLRGVSATNDYKLSHGHRAIWADRTKLAIAKVAAAGKGFVADPAATLLRPGLGGGTDDVFVEVHIWGDLTIRSFAFVTIRLGHVRPSYAELEVVRQNLSRYSIPVDIV